jgi:hypothetical protein
VIAEAFGMCADGVGEHSHVVSQALGHDIEVTPRVLEMSAGFLGLALKLPPCLLRLLPHLPLQDENRRVDARESPIDSFESRIHRSLELGNGHWLTRTAHHSIVGNAMTMPSPDRSIARSLEKPDEFLAAPMTAGQDAAGSAFVSRRGLARFANDIIEPDPCD